MNTKTLREITYCVAVTLLIAAASAFVLSAEQHLTAPETPDETKTGLPLSHPPSLATTH